MSINEKFKTSSDEESEKEQSCKQQGNNIKSTLSKFKKIIMVLGGILLVLIIVILVLPSKIHNKSKQLNNKPSVRPAVTSSPKTPADTLLKTQAGDYIKQRLQDISDQLGTIRTNLSGNGAANFASISKQLSDLIEQTRQLSSESNKIITQQIQKSTGQLKKQLTSINAELIKLQQEQKRIKYLKPTDLPFKVVSIDNIQQNNVVTINYSNTTFPIEINSYVAGWKLIRADFVGQKAEFVNAQHQHVIVDLNRMAGKKNERNKEVNKKYKKGKIKNRIDRKNNHRGKL
jgi:hypothetical protein